MREHMLAQLSQDHGVTPRAIFIGIAPRLNRRADAAFRVYASELLPIADSDTTRVRFRHFTLEALIDAIDVAGGQEIADQLWKRYCDFQRVYDAALAVIAAKAPDREAPSSAAASPAVGEKSKKRSRKTRSRIEQIPSTEATEAAHG